MRKSHCLGFARVFHIFHRVFHSSNRYFFKTKSNPCFTTDPPDPASDTELPPPHGFGQFSQRPPGRQWFLPPSGFGRNCGQKAPTGQKPAPATAAPPRLPDTVPPSCRAAAESWSRFPCPHTALAGSFGLHSLWPAPIPSFPPAADPADFHSVPPAH